MGRPTRLARQDETFKLSPDPLFIDKVRDIVGLYLNPPDKALVLCVEEIEEWHSHTRKDVNIEWGPEVYRYGRREFGF